MTPEGRVKLDIKKYLAALVKAGECYYFMPVQGGFGKATVDILVCYKGRFFAIEVKKPDPKYPIPRVTSRQEQTMDEVRQAGGVAFAASDVDRVKAMLTA